MIDDMGATSRTLALDQGSTESDIQDSDLAFHVHAVAEIGSLYWMASLLAPDNGQAAELLREAIEAASERWSARPPHQSPAVWLMKALRDQAVAWRLSGRLETERPSDHEISSGDVLDPLVPPGWGSIDSLTYDHREALAFSEITYLTHADLAIVLGTTAEDASERVRMARRQLLSWAVGRA